MDYWARKDEMKKKAETHDKLMWQWFPNEIQECISQSKIFSHEAPALESGRVGKRQTVIELMDTDSVSAVRHCATWSDDKRVCVLNFASYKNPGGMFMKGSSAQEESLCHESTLYQVLSQMEPYYEYNRQRPNSHLYTNRAIYSPDVVFKSPGEEARKADVLTCAAPNRRAAMEYRSVTEEQNKRALISRIEFVLGVAANRKVDILVLGAFGCGVFGQHPSAVAAIFLDYLTTEYKGVFEKVLFAIPDATSKNYQAFYRAINGLNK